MSDSWRRGVTWEQFEQGIGERDAKPPGGYSVAPADAPAAELDDDQAEGEAPREA